MNQLEKDTYSAKDISSEIEIASYAPGAVAESMLVSLRWMAEDVTRGGATYTIRAKLGNDEDGEAWTAFEEQYVHAGAAGNIGGVIPALPLKPSETLSVTLESTDAGDTSRAGAVWFFDAATVQVTATGLDNVATTAPTGVASNFREMLVQTWRRFFCPAAKDIPGTTLETFADNGVDVLTTQPISDSGTQETQGLAV